MKILIVTQYFWPENFRINDLAQALLARGHAVTVLTGIPNYPGGKFFDGYGFCKRRREDYRGIEVIRVPLFPRGSGGGLRLALNFFSFAFFGALLGPFYCRDKYDLIFTYEPSPVTVGIPAAVLRRLKGAPHLFWVLDLWPESLTAAGTVRNRFALWLVDRLARWVYRRSDRVLVQSQAFTGYLQAQGVPPAKIIYFPNWAEEIFEEAGAAGAVPDEADALPGGFRVIFAGNIGAAQDFPAILSAAEQLKERCPAVRWIILGDGRMAGWVREEVVRRNLCGTVLLLGERSLGTMPGYFSRADVMLVTLKKDPVFARTIPGKIQSYLACGRPIVAALDGEGARVIVEAGAGTACPAEAPTDLARAVEALQSLSREERETMGRRGKEYYNSHFRRSMLLDRLEEVAREAVSGKSVRRKEKGELGGIEE